MKRSEMLHKLYDAVDEALNSPNFTGNLVDFVLDKSIEFGMQPPKVQTLKEVQGKLGQKPGAFNYLESVNEWEPEDEQ